mmetsp:Transcript_19452/g.47030  ORF Transcript_19452/g.47030 Transcript_19452/m.47030 type:complete len:327 (-) Transcript_19452:1946-2926(-)
MASSLSESTASSATFVKSVTTAAQSGSFPPAPRLVWTLSSTGQHPALLIPSLEHTGGFRVKPPNTPVERRSKSNAAASPLILWRSMARRHALDGGSLARTMVSERMKKRIITPGTKADPTPASRPVCMTKARDEIASARDVINDVLMADAPDSSSDSSGSSVELELWSGSESTEKYSGFMSGSSKTCSTIAAGGISSSVVTPMTPSTTLSMSSVSSRAVAKLLSSSPDDSAMVSATSRPSSVAPTVWMTLVMSTDASSLLSLRRKKVLARIRRLTWTFSSHVGLSMQLSRLCDPTQNEKSQPSQLIDVAMFCRRFLARAWLMAQLR